MAFVTVPPLDVNAADRAIDIMRADCKACEKRPGGTGTRILVLCAACSQGQHAEMVVLPKLLAMGWRRPMKEHAEWLVNQAREAPTLIVRYWPGNRSGFILVEDDFDTLLRLGTTLRAKGLTASAKIARGPMVVDWPALIRAVVKPCPLREALVTLVALGNPVAAHALVVAEAPHLCQVRGVDRVVPPKRSRKKAPTPPVDGQDGAPPAPTTKRVRKPRKPKVAPAPP